MSIVILNWSLVRPAKLQAVPRLHSSSQVELAGQYGFQKHLVKGDAHGITSAPRREIASAVAPRLSSFGMNIACRWLHVAHLPKEASGHHEHQHGYQQL